MNLIFLTKYKWLFLKNHLYNTILKRIILASSIKQRKNQLSKPFITSSVFVNPLNTFNYSIVRYKLKELFFLKFKKSALLSNNNILDAFFSNKIYYLTLVLKITKFNFFILPTSNSHPNWRMFGNNNMKLSSKSIKNPLASTFIPLTTITAGQLSDKRKGRVRFEKFQLGISFSMLILSVFWSCLNKVTTRSFKFTIKIKCRYRWVWHIIRIIRKAFRNLYKEHKWYIKRQKNLLRKTDGSITVNNEDIIKYEHSVKRLKQIVNCPIFFETLQLFKQIPHNGCRLKKKHITRKDIKRISRRRLNR